MAEAEQFEPCPMCGAAETLYDDGFNYWIHNEGCPSQQASIEGTMEIKRFLYAKFHAELMNIFKWADARAKWKRSSVETFCFVLCRDKVRFKAIKYAPAKPEEGE